jgi:NADH:ubiquinone oxidoreductase subunit 5 (subunit L)/multisubunit Na+/H+ antiporter MnhA subunit
VATPAIFYAVHHTLVKGGLFLAVGVGALTRARGLWLVMIPATVIALGLGGLPLTGGALAKLAIKGSLGEGVAGTLATLSSIASTVLMFHFLRRLKSNAPQDPDAAAPTGLVLPWLAIAFAAIVLPWVLYPRIMGGSFHDVLAPKELWSALWPVLIGGLLSVGLGRFGERLPQIPAGDVLVIAESATPAACSLAAAMEGFDRRLREWPAASLLLLALTIVLVGAMFAGR